MYIRVLPVWVRGFSSSDPRTEMKLRKLMDFPGGWQGERERERGKNEGRLKIDLAGIHWGQ